MRYENALLQVESGAHGYELYAMNVAVVYKAFESIYFIMIDGKGNKEPEINGFATFLSGFELTQMANKFQN